MNKSYHYTDFQFFYCHFLFYLPFLFDVFTDSGILAVGIILIFDVLSATVLTSSLFEELAALSLDPEAGVLTFTAFMLDILRIADSFFPFLLGECLSAEIMRASDQHKLN